VTQAIQKLARHDPLHPAMVVTGILIVAGTAKLGHGMWGVGGLLAFYPIYLAMLIAGRTAAAALARFGLLLLSALQPACRYAVVRVRR
jgi:hypothetical protein